MIKTFFTLWILFLAASSSFACLCDDYDSDAQLIEAHDYVIHGTIISKSRVTHSDSIKIKTLEGTEGFQLRTEDVFEMKVRVKQVYKGTITENVITLYTQFDLCKDTRFKVNTEYFIYGYDKNLPYVIQNRPNAFWTTICSRNRVFSEKHEHTLKQHFHR